MPLKFLLGFDIGSSSVKAALVDAATGKIAASAFSPSSEMEIISVKPGFAEQHPEKWWQELLHATDKLKQSAPFEPGEIIAIGISYQMHGLVCVDKNLQPLRPAIIWCDSRAVGYGDKAFADLGREFCLENFLNSPGNFTASKLKWVKENEPDVYSKIYKIMLPGDYIAMKLTGIPATTVSGLSEGILWNYQSQSVSKVLLNYYQIDEQLLPPVVPTFGEQGRVCAHAAETLGVAKGTPVCYRAGDQPNNAYSLKVLEPGEIAATAGTSGVVYGITDQAEYDLQSRVNTFVHVNNTDREKRYGILLCVNGAGILNSWIQKNFFSGLTYREINDEAAKISIGAEGLQFFPFGNGAERVLANKNIAANLKGLQFNTHTRAHVARAAQEGIVFALNFGMEIMKGMGMELKTVRAGHANLFLSGVFAQTFSNVSNCEIELYNTDGAVGAARAAGAGAGHYKNFSESFHGMEMVRKMEPEQKVIQQTNETYQNWKEELKKMLANA
ncbi:MAG: carbohydrate kinase [Bacteroidetes bacterium]|nr:carbohydrate kinase [Bacteroidota bacterium]